MPPNSYWRWPYWDVQNISFLTNTQLGATSYVKAKIYYNTFKNGLDAYDDITYTTQSANGRFSSPYDDHAYGGGAEFGTTPTTREHDQGDRSTTAPTCTTKQQTNRPTNPTLSTTEPNQEQSQNTWSIARGEHLPPHRAVDLVAGVSYDNYDITKAAGVQRHARAVRISEGRLPTPFNWQAAVIWRYSAAGQVHASVSDRARFPVIFELYSTRFGTATPNPDLGPERATNLEVGWKGDAVREHCASGATVFYSDVTDLIQTVVLPDTTTQTQNVGNGDFYGVEVSVECQVTRQLSVGAQLHRTCIAPSRTRCSRTCGRPACRRTRRFSTRRGARSIG